LRCYRNIEDADGELIWISPRLPSFAYKVNAFKGKAIRPQLHYLFATSLRLRRHRVLSLLAAQWRMQEI
jgi:hypothetical protein